MSKTQAELDFMHNFRHETEGEKWGRDAEIAELMAALAQGIVNFENQIEHAMGVRIEELERERDALLAHNERLRDALLHYGEHEGSCSIIDLDDDGYHCDCDCGFSHELAATPEQSLARIRNQVREECAAVCYEQNWQLHGSEMAALIEATKEEE